MGNLQIIKDTNKVIICVTDKVDSSNSMQLEQEILKEIQPECSVVIDFDHLDYISSAGLRMVLKIAKTVKEFEVINVSRDVYEVFDMTGFTQILKVRKALRELSVAGKELIGEGYMGKVYRLDPDTIIKVYTRYNSMTDIEREINLAKKTFVMGIPTAIPFDVVKVKEGGFGSVFELINSIPLNKLMANEPQNLRKYFDMYIDLLKTMMSVTVSEDSGLPNCKDTARSWIKFLKENDGFDNTTLTKLDALVESIPDSDHFVHGDYHIKNIMVQNGEPLLIDMDTVGRGHPIFEISAFFLTYIGYPSTEQGNIEKFLEIPDKVAKDLFNETIDFLFSDKSDKEKEDILNKISLFSYMWLTYKTIRFEKENLKRLLHARESVLELVDKYQTLNF